MLRTLIISALAAVPALLASARAQPEDPRSVASAQLLRQCTAMMAEEPDPPANGEAQCQCFATIALEGWSEREMALFARVFAHYPDRDAARSELEGMIANEGYTMDDYRAVGARLDTAADTVGDRCDGEGGAK
jgi:hypothetical protein